MSKVAMRLLAALPIYLTGCVGADAGAVEPRASFVAEDDAALPPAASGETDAVAECAAPSAAPRDDAAARDDFRAGLTAYEAQDYAEAAELFCRAYRAHPHFTLLYNVARSWENAGDLERAARFYDAFADADEAGPMARDARERARALRAATSRR
jgi:hypothetical protein